MSRMSEELSRRLGSSADWHAYGQSRYPNAGINYNDQNWASVVADALAAGTGAFAETGAHLANDLTGNREGDPMGWNAIADWGKATRERNTHDYMPGSPRYYASTIAQALPEMGADMLASMGVGAAAGAALGPQAAAAGGVLKSLATAGKWGKRALDFYNSEKKAAKVAKFLTPSMAAETVPAWAAATATGMGLEGAFEGQRAMDEYIEEAKRNGTYVPGQTENEARNLRWNVFADNQILLGGTNALENLMLFGKGKGLANGLKRLAVASGIEGFEEGAQQIIPKAEQGKNWNVTDRDVLESAAIGALMGGGMHLAGRGIRHAFPNAFGDNYDTSNPMTDPARTAERDSDVPLPTNIDFTEADPVDVMRWLNTQPGFSGVDNVNTGADMPQAQQGQASQPASNVDLSDIPMQDFEDKGLAKTNNTLKGKFRQLYDWTVQSFGKKVEISGGWRSPEHNKEVNGSEHSHHLSGNALDVNISMLSDAERDAFIQKAKEMGFNADGDDFYHDKGSGYHAHLVYKDDGSASQPRTGKREGHANAWAITDVFRRAGYNDEAIAGILGRVQQEHNFDTSDVPEHWDTDANGKKVWVGGYGMFQWNGGRTTAFLEWTKQNGRDPQNPTAQAEYALLEAKQRGLTPEKMNSLSAEEAADLWTSDWEVGKPGSERKYAGEWRERLKNGGGGVSTNSISAQDFGKILGNHMIDFAGSEDDAIMNNYQQIMDSLGDDAKSVLANKFANMFNADGSFNNTAENRQALAQDAETAEVIRSMAESVAPQIVAPMIRNGRIGKQAVKDYFTPHIAGMNMHFLKDAINKDKLSDVEKVAVLQEAENQLNIPRLKKSDVEQAKFVNDLQKAIDARDFKKIYNLMPQDTAKAIAKVTRPAQAQPAMPIVTQEQADARLNGIQGLTNTLNAVAAQKWDNSEQQMADRTQNLQGLTNILNGVAAQKWDAGEQQARDMSMGLREPAKAPARQMATPEEQARLNALTGQQNGNEIILPNQQNPQEAEANLNALRQSAGVTNEPVAPQVPGVLQTAEDKVAANAAQARQWQIQTALRNGDYDLASRLMREDGRNVGADILDSVPRRPYSREEFDNRLAELHNMPLRQLEQVGQQTLDNMQAAGVPVSEALANDLAAGKENAIAHAESKMVEAGVNPTGSNQEQVQSAPKQESDVNSIVKALKKELNKIVEQYRNGDIDYNNAFSQVTNLCQKATQENPEITTDVVEVYNNTVKKLNEVYQEAATNEANKRQKPDYSNMSLDELKAERQRLIDEEVDRMNRNPGGKGTNNGYTYNDRGEITGRYGESLNPQWYQDAYAELGRAPRKKEYPDIALKNLQKHQEFAELEDAIAAQEKQSAKNEPSTETETTENANSNKEAAGNEMVTAVLDYARKRLANTPRNRYEYAVLKNFIDRNDAKGFVDMYAPVDKQLNDLIISIANKHGVDTNVKHETIDVNEFEERQKAAEENAPKERPKVYSKKEEVAPETENPFGDLDETFADLAKQAGITPIEQEKAEPKAKSTTKEKPKKKKRNMGLSDTSKEREEELKKQLSEALKKSRNRLNSTPVIFDPDVIVPAFNLGRLYVQRGAENFAEYARDMINAVGDSVRGWLRPVWEMIENYQDGKNIDESLVIPAFRYVGSFMHSKPQATYDEVRADFVKRAGEDTAAKFDDLLKLAYSGAYKFYNDNEEVTDNELNDSSRQDSARDSAGNNQDEVGADDGSGRPGIGGGRGVSSTETGVRAHGSSNIRGGSSTRSGKEGNSGVQKETPGNRSNSTGSQHNTGSSADNVAGEPISDDGRSGQGIAPAKNRPDNAGNRGNKTEAVKVNKDSFKAGDKAQIAGSMPFLMKEQVDDVVKADTRLYTNNGEGMMFTNGTGTGKTFTGLGCVKRAVQQGKKNILIIAPNESTKNAWITAGKGFFGLEITELKDTKDKGEGIVITSYKNVSDNNNLVKRDWDMIVADESHKLMRSEKGNNTKALENVRAMTYHADGLRERFERLHAKEYDRLAELRGKASDKEHPITAAEKQELEKLQAKLIKEQEKAVAEWKQIPQADKPKVLFLSATPFSHVPDIDYAEGYLFHYDRKKNQNGGYNQPNAYDDFMIKHFGYRMRMGKLTKPDADVNSDLMEINFNKWLKDQGVLSGRKLKVDKDYERGYILVDGGVGKQIDEGMKIATEWGISDSDQKYGKLHDLFENKLKGNKTRYLLEAIKANEAVDLIKQYVKGGKKVVVFHGLNQSKAENPFVLTDEDFKGMDEVDRNTARQQYARFCKDHPELLNLNLDELPSPIERLTAEFGDTVRTYNGTVSKKKKNEAVREFNDDASKVKIILCQRDSAAEGISLHDTTGKHQRVLIDLGLPTKPTDMIQCEGRIYRTGVVTDAIIRYLNTGTDMEKRAFASTIASRASTAENLSMGEEARALRNAIVEGFMESLDGDSWKKYLPNTKTEGKGGKERDAKLMDGVTPYEAAKSDYFANQKKNSRNKAQEGIDYFPTPEPIGFKMVEWLGLKPGDRALEPSAGHGAISRYFGAETRNTIVEPSPELATLAKMRLNGGETAKVVEGRFEDLDIHNKYEGIVMNPPYGVGGKTAYEHVAKAFDHLADGGRLIAIVPDGPAANKRLENWLIGDGTKANPGKPNAILLAEIKLPQVTFNRAGTSVATKILIIDKYNDPADFAEMERRQIEEGIDSLDLTGVKDINELFDKLEYVRTPERVGSDIPRHFTNSTNKKGNAQYKYITLPDDVKLLDNRKVWELANFNGGYRNINGGWFEFRNENDRAKFNKAANKYLAGQETLASEQQDIVDEVLNQPEGTTEHFEGGNFKDTDGTSKPQARIKGNMPRNVYDPVKSLAQRHGGQYKKGARGFVFDSEDDRNAFLKEAEAYLGDVDFSATGNAEEMRREITFTPDNKLTEREKELQRMGERMGVPIVFFEGDKNLNGFHRNGISFINRKAGMSAPWTFWHEAFHWLSRKNPALFASLMEHLKSKAPFSKEQLNAYRASIGEPNMSDEKVIEEMMADAMPKISKRLPFLKDLAAENKSLYQRFVAWIREAMDTLRDFFHSNPNGLSTEQVDLMHEKFADLVRDIHDLHNKPIIKVASTPDRTFTLPSGEPLVNYSVAQQPDSANTTLDVEYFSAIRDMENAKTDAEREAARQKLVKMVEQAAKEAGFENAIPEQATTYTIRTKAAPKKTIKVYKVFMVDENGNPTALFVNGGKSLPQGVWMDAVEAWHFTGLNGREYAPTTKNPNAPKNRGGQDTPIPNEEVRQELIKRGFLSPTSTAKAINTVAYRPGWHGGTLPFFPQGGTSKKGSPYGRVLLRNQVVFECEMAAEKNYTQEAENQPRARGKNGKVNGREADLKYLPKNGFYWYATNPLTRSNPQLGAWAISDSLKINRALSQEECNKIMRENNMEPQGWTEEVSLADLGYTGPQHDAARKTLAPITYDDNGNIIPLSQRFDAEKDDVRYSVGSVDAPGAMERIKNATRKLLGLQEKLEDNVQDRHTEKQNQKTSLDDTIPLTSMMHSMKYLAGKNEAIKRMYYLGKRCMDEQEHLRNEFKEVIRKINTLMADEADRDSLHALLWAGDADGKEYTAEELQQEGFSDNVIAAYKMVRDNLAKAYNLVNDARMQVKVRNRTIKASELPEFMKENFIDSGDIINTQDVGNGKIVVTYRGAKVYENRTDIVNDDMLKAMEADDNIVITNKEELGKGVYNITYNEKPQPMGKLTGYMPHFFHRFMVYAKTKDENGNDMRVAIGSAESLADATKIANEVAKHNPDMQFVIDTHSFEYGDENNGVVVGDLNYQEMTKRLAENTEMSLTEANKFLHDSAGATLKSRHRFFGNMMKRTGVQGFDENMMWALTHYFNSAARYVAMEHFKPDAISWYERFFGDFNADPKTIKGQNKRKTAQIIRDYINDVNGTPREIEKWCNEVVDRIPIIGEKLNDTYNGRPALALSSKVSWFNAVTKLGCLSISSPMLNFMQFINVATMLDSVKYAKLGLNKALKPSELDNLILDRSGIMDEINLASDAGGYTQSRDYGGVHKGLGKGKEWLDKSMFFFTWCDALMRKAAVLGAYYQGVQEKGMKPDNGQAISAEALEYAREVNSEANFDYSAANTPEAIRMGSVITQQAFQFQKYPIMQFEFFWNHVVHGTNSQRAKFLMPYFLLTGLPGMIPFGELLAGMLGLLIPGDDDDFAKKMKAELMRWAGDDSAKQAVVNSLTNGPLAAFTGIDISERAGMQNFFAGRYYGSKPESTPGAVGTLLGGAAYSTVSGVQNQLRNGNPIEAIKAVSPGLGNWLQAAVGETRTTHHRVGSTYDGMYERILHGMGFRHIDETNTQFINSYLYESRKRQQEDKKFVMDAYLDDPSEENKEQLIFWGISDKQLKQYKEGREKSSRDRAVGEDEKKKKSKKPKTEAQIEDDELRAFMK